MLGVKRVPNKLPGFRIRYRILNHERSYSSSRYLSMSDENATAVDIEKIKQDALQKKLEAKLAARDFNNRRAAYKRQVSMLRRTYAEQILQQRAADLAEEEDRRVKLTRQRLERQRRKNMKSAANALREEEIRKQREREFNEYLHRQQVIRDAKKERYTAARQMVIDELEEEAPLWLTTPQEVEAVFSDPKTEQLLWARPGGILGAPHPSVDSHFWQFETHTWNMDKTYRSQRQILLEDIEELAYNEANVDNSFWTPERIAEHEKLEEKAKLRAMVHSAGRSNLLSAQRQIILDDSENEELPSAWKAPNLNILNDDETIENEGARVLMNNPTKFFIFDSEHNVGDTSEEVYEGPTLGAPIGLRDPLRDEYTGTVFPEVVGKFPKPDTRTEREKKQEEREEKMWAAAQAEAKKELEASGGILAEVDDLDDGQPPVNYDELDENDSDDEEWMRGLDPETDASIIDTPRDYRYKENDVEWVFEKLDAKMKFLDRQFAQDIEIIKEEAKVEIRRNTAADDSLTMQDSKLDHATLEAALLALPETQLMALSDLEEEYVPGKMADYELAAAINEIPGLTEEQIMMILNRDRSLD